MSGPAATAPFPPAVDLELLDRGPSYSDDMSSTSSTASASDHDQPDPNKLARPRLGSRKSSGTIIIPRDSLQVELKEEEYDDGDARTMSPRRSSEEIEKMGHEARQALIDPTLAPRLTAFARQAKALQASLLEIVDRVEIVRSEHEKLEGGNKFLQSYIGELMQTSKITAAGAAKGNKGKGKSRTIK